MIYLYNTSATPLEYITMGEYYGKITSNRENRKKKTTELIGLALSSKLDIADLSKYSNMDSECALICDAPTTVKYRNTDLKPWIGEVTNPNVRNNDVFYAIIPLFGGVIKNIQGANVLGYKIINNEFIVYFTAKCRQNTCETPIFTIANDNERTETDYVFERDDENSYGYHVVVNYYNMNEDQIIPTKPMTIKLYRYSSVTKLIFVHEEDIDVFNKIFGNKYEKNIVVTVNDQNINDEIKKYTDQKYTAATFFQDIKSKKELDKEEIVAKTVSEKFYSVNVLTNNKFVYIVK